MAGLDDALVGVEAVVDVTNPPAGDASATQRFFAAGTGQVLAAEQRAGVRHHVVLSIVGVDRVLCDGYDQSRTPAMPLPIPPGARPARLTTPSIGIDMLIELVATGDAVTVLPSWVIAPYLATHDVASVAIGDPPQHRTWYCATRPERSDVIDAVVVAILHAHLAGQAPRARTRSAA